MENPQATNVEVTFFLGETDNRKNKKSSHIVQEKEFRAVERTAKERSLGDMLNAPSQPVQLRRRRRRRTSARGLYGVPSHQPSPRMHSSVSAECQLPCYYSHPHYRTVLTPKHNKHAAAAALAVPRAVRRQGLLLEMLERAVTATGREDKLTP